MKLASLLVQYLYTHKRLDLPGIGTFSINDRDITESESHKHDKHANQGAVYFESNAAIKLSPDLVQFIADKTGKIKALASADLESHLALAHQFLNIGNPFLFEGIGTIEKIKPGEYIFTHGTGMHEKAKELLSREKTNAPVSRESLKEYDKIYTPEKEKMKWRRPVAFLLIIAGLALAVWGGYTVYKKTKAKKESLPSEKNKEEDKKQVKETPPKDPGQIENTNTTTTVQQTPSGMQKFILEISDSIRAHERYSRLKTFQWNVQMETKDSVKYKLFLLLPASPNDTSHIIDSLSRLNGRRVFVER